MFLATEYECACVIIIFIDQKMFDDFRSVDVKVEAEAGAAEAAGEEAEGKKPCVGVFGSFSATLKDGMTLSFSTYGKTGEPVDGKKYAPEPYVPPRAPTPAPAGGAAADGGKGTPGKGKKEKGGKGTTPEPTQQQVGEPDCMF